GMSRKARLARKRARLRQIPLAAAWPPRRGELTVTMSVGQWDGLLQGTYDAGAMLLELDDSETPVAAYQGLPPEVNGGRRAVRARIGRAGRGERRPCREHERHDARLGRRRPQGAARGRRRGGQACRPGEGRAGPVWGSHVRQGPQRGWP